MSNNIDSYYGSSYLMLERILPEVERVGNDNRMHKRD